MVTKRFDDLLLLCLTAFLRALSTGLIGVLLGIYLAKLRFDAAQIGYVIPGFRGKAEKSHDLGHPRTGSPFPAGDVGLVADLAGVELSPPLDGLAEELGNVGGLGARRLFEIAPGQRNNAHVLVVLNLSCQGADLAVFNDPDGAEGDFHFLFAVGRQGRAILADQGGVDYSEPDLGPGGTRSVRRE